VQIWKDSPYPFPNQLVVYFTPVLNTRLLPHFFPLLYLCLLSSSLLMTISLLLIFFGRPSQKSSYGSLEHMLKSYRLFLFTLHLRYNLTLLGVFICVYWLRLLIYFLFFIYFMIIQTFSSFPRNNGLYALT
jgi:hypothetical protein